MESNMNKTAMVTAVVVSTVMAGAALAAEPYLPRIQRAFERVDADRDGKLTAAEFTLAASKRFMRDDANKDGAVSSAEIDAALLAAMQKRRDRMLASLDTDKNGSITQPELDAYVQAMLKAADADSDGSVTLAEARGFRLAKWRKTLQTGGQNQ